MSSEIEDKIESLAEGGIAESEGDGHKMKAQPLPDLIEADRYISAKTAATKSHRGLRITKLIPPGTV